MDMEDFNTEPVYYCKHCLSLKIASLKLGNEDVDYCDKCKDTDIGVTDINTWDEMYFSKYHHHFMEEDRNGYTHQERMENELRELLNLH